MANFNNPIGEAIITQYFKTYYPKADSYDVDDLIKDIEHADELLGMLYDIAKEIPGAERIASQLQDGAFAAFDVHSFVDTGKVANDLEECERHRFFLEEFKAAEAEGLVPSLPEGFEEYRYQVWRNDYETNDWTFFDGYDSKAEAIDAARSLDKYDVSDGFVLDTMTE